MNGEGVEGATTRVSSSVLFVSRLNRSIEFYRNVFSCTATIHYPDAALLLAPDGFQIYLIARGTRAEHPSGGIGLQYLIWAVDSDADLRNIAQALQERVDGRPPTPAAACPSWQRATRMASGSWWPTRARKSCPARSWALSCTYESPQTPKGPLHRSCRPSATTNDGCDRPTAWKPTPSADRLEITSQTNAMHVLSESR
jgi:hypothetical protein